METSETLVETRKRKAEEDNDRRLKRAKILEERERDFFTFKKDEDKPSDKPLEGEDLEIELQLYKKMREKVVQDVKKHFEVPFVRSYLLPLMQDLTAEEFAASELQIYAQSLINPCSLHYKHLPNGDFKVYQHKKFMDVDLPINGTYRINDSVLADPPDDAFDSLLHYYTDDDDDDDDDDDEDEDEDDDDNVFIYNL